MQAAFRFLILIWALSTNLWANVPTSPWYTQGKDNQVVINVELFLSSTCMHCHKADAFFHTIEATNPWLHVNRYVINQDKSALARFGQLLIDQKANDFAVPSVFFCNSRWVGFASAETTGKDLLHALNYCKQQIEKKRKLTDSTVDVLKRWGNANLFDSGIVDDPSAIKYTSVIAMIDAFNPCALFCITGFFALLFIQDSRKKQLITGILFIFAIGGVHYFQQVFANTFFELLPWLRIPAVFVGLLTFYVAGQYYRKRTHSHLFFLLVILLAFMIQSYQQTCLMNWAYIFEQGLNNQHLSKEQIGFYQLIYQSLYLLPITLFLILYLILIRVNFLAKRKTKLNTIGLLFIMAIALLLIIYPLALSNLALSLFTIISLTIAGWFLSRFNDPALKEEQIKK